MGFPRMHRNKDRKAYGGSVSVSICEVMPALGEGHELDLI